MTYEQLKRAEEKAVARVAAGIPGDEERARLWLAAVRTRLRNKAAAERG